MIYLNLIQNIALLISLSVVQGFVARRFKKHGIVYQSILGLIFGIMCVIGMLTSVELAPGVIFDGRSIILSVAGFFGGPITAIIGALISGVYRYSVGGGGVWMGISVITESALLGILFFYLRKRFKFISTILSIYIFGLIVHIIMVLLTITLPGGIKVEIFQQIGLPVLIIYPVATLLVCQLFIDVESKIVSEEALRQSEEKLNAILDNVGAYIYMKDNNYRYTYVNKKLCELFGKKTTDILGKGDDVFFDKDSVKEIRLSDEPVILKGETVKREEVNLSSTDRIPHTYWSIKIPLKNKEGIIYGLCGISTDITELKKAEELLKAAKEEAEEVSRLKSSFLANMSHELRTPMVGILGFSELLTQKNADEEVITYADMIHKSGSRLMETLNMILDLSIVESDKLKISYKEFDLISEINYTIELFTNEATKKNLFFNIETKFKSLFIKSDEKAIHQVLNNLVNNAIKFTNEGGVTILVDKENKNQNKFIVIRVKDTGIGIPDDKKNLVWDEFRQVSEGIGRSFEGTGLGLSISRKFVQKLGGEIIIEETKLNSGTTFKISLPYIPVDNNKSIIKTSDIKSIYIKEEESEEIQLPELLYVEDDLDAYELVRKYAEKYCRIDLAENSEEAIKKVKSKKYPAILMDINLGKGRDGLQTTEIIRKIPGYESIPIAAVTAFAMKEEQEEFLNNGCTHYISKPFTKSEFIDLIYKIIALK